MCTMKNTKKEMLAEIVRLNNVINSMAIEMRDLKPAAPVAVSRPVPRMPQWQADRAAAMNAAREMAVRFGQSVKV